MIRIRHYYGHEWIEYEDFTQDPAISFSGFLTELQRCRRTNLSYFLFQKNFPHANDTVFQIFPEANKNVSELYLKVQDIETDINRPELYCEYVTFKQKYLNPKAVQEFAKLKNAKNWFHLPWKEVVGISVLNLKEGLYFEPFWFDVLDESFQTIQQLPVCIDIHSKPLPARMNTPQWQATVLPIAFDTPLKKKILESVSPHEYDSNTPGVANFGEIVSDGFCIHNGPFYAPGDDAKAFSKVFAKYPYKFVFFPEDLTEVQAVEDMLLDSIINPKCILQNEPITDWPNTFLLQTMIYHENTL